MTYEVLLTKTADKCQKKLDKPLREKVRDSLLEIAEDPENMGEKLCTPLTDVYSHHIKYKGNEYRVAYTIDEEDMVVVIHLIAAHENFYRRLRQVLNR
ncbi:MAG: type II toxin-antitoxin system RelE/ParE family toxin [Cyanobacteriota bacterium]